MESTNLPSDMIFEILTRTKSLENLDTCKTVSNHWNHIINEWSFMPNYCQRTNNVFGYFLQALARNGYCSQFVSIDQAKGAWQWSNNTRIDSLPHDVQILASCHQGILCCVKTCKKRPNARYYVCKPSTKQWQRLPNPKTRFQTHAIGIMVLQSDDNYLRYKIVRISHRHNLRYPNKEGTTYNVEVFDSGTWSWSVKEDLILPFEEIISSCPGGPAVELNNSLHWLTSHDNVLVFRTNNNLFDKFSLREEEAIDNSYGNKKLLEYQGKLGFMRETHERVELWVMEKHNHWVKKISINMKTEAGEHVEHPGLEGFYNAEIAFMTGYGEAAFHKVQDGSYGIVKLDKMTYPIEVFTFRSDLKSVNLRPKIEEVSKAHGITNTRRLIFSIATILWIIASFIFLFKFGL